VQGFSPAEVVVQGFSPALTESPENFSCKVAHHRCRWHGCGIWSCHTGSMITKRPKRLDGVSYVGFQRYFLTFCTAYRHRAFENYALVDSCLVQLRLCAERHDIALVAYCFMPDHVHLLVSGVAESTDVRAFVAAFKQATGFAYRRQHEKRLWQPGYFDRMLRDDEATEAVARYILENPVRAGLTAQLGEYQPAGSDLYDFQELLSVWDRAGLKSCTTPALRQRQD
jgi:putative transposase